MPIRTPIPEAAPMIAERRTPEPDGDEFVSELFHENTKQRRSDTRFVERILSATYDPAMHRALAPKSKNYALSQRIALPRARAKGRMTLHDALLARRSDRAFTGDPLALRDLARLLRAGAGVTGSLDAGNGERVPLRAAPSGGALYPVETYVLARHVDGLAPGVYHFAPTADALDPVAGANPFPALVRATYEPQLRRAAVAFVLTGISIKSRLKYGERGYRFMLLEAGHIAQNLLLAATAMRLRSFTLGGFVDDELDALLRVDGADETSLYVIAAGR
jgi:SagB-type dehydrogenase family enzyme